MESNKVEELIELLQGSCMTLDEAVRLVMEDDEADSNTLTPDNFEQLYNEIFLCDNCGWWCELSEQTEDADNGEICKDCEEDL